MSIINAANRLKDEVSLVELLARLGYDPAKRSGHETIYNSMIRDGDSTPSFAVHDKLGVWFDHGLGKGGNIIDFGLAYWPRLNFRSVVEKLTTVMDLPIEEFSDLRNSVRPRPRLAVKVPHYIVFETKPLGTHPAITTYLQSRGVFEAGKDFLSEIYYYVEDDNGNRKRFFSAGWKNENGGWMVRNKYFKGCVGSQGITIIPGDNKNVALFEGFLDFLSWRVEHPADPKSVIVLNSVTGLKPGIAAAKAYSSIDLFFDRDKIGFQATQDFIAVLPYATDRSRAYEGFNDYNDKLKDSLTIEIPHKPNIFSGVNVPFER